MGREGKKNKKGINIFPKKGFLGEGGTLLPRDDPKKFCALIKQKFYENGHTFRENVFLYKEKNANSAYR